MKFLDFLFVTVTISPGIVLCFLQKNWLHGLFCSLTILWMSFFFFVAGMAYKSYILDEDRKRLEKTLKL